MHEVEKLCSRVAIIHKGRVQAEGTPDELLDEFDQPDLEELFFYLVERAETRRRQRRARLGAAGLVPWRPSTAHRDRFVRSWRDPTMRWSNLLVIFRREVRDQIRDRRTLFMIFVLPILLYPMLGIGMIKFAAALEQKPRSWSWWGRSILPKLTASCSTRVATASTRHSSTRRAKPSGCVVRREPANGPLGRPAYRASRRSAIGEVVGRDGDPARPAGPASARKRRSISRSSTTASTSPARSPICGSKRCWSGGARASSPAG